jgi:serine/threonine protein phosphatase 1
MALSASRTGSSRIASDMPHPRLAFTEWPAAVYAIGDVHGCLDELLALEAEIERDARDLAGEKWLVTVGDHIDRGPRSAEVIEHLMAPPPRGFRRFSLFGNHEQMLLDFRDDPAANAYWLDEGGAETLASYGIAASNPHLVAGALVRRQIDERLPLAHREFIEGLPIWLSLPGWLFVHAGVQPDLPLSMQADEDLIWIRAPFLKAPLTQGVRVVHGHTPGRDIVQTRYRIDIDTHCYHTGRLSAVRVTPDGRTAFLSVGEKRGRWWDRLRSG